MPGTILGGLHTISLISHGNFPREGLSLYPLDVEKVKEIADILMAFIAERRHSNSHLSDFHLSELSIVAENIAQTWV